MAGLSPTDEDVRVGERITTLRKRMGVVRRQCADAVGVSSAQFQKYEKGINRISGVALGKLARLLFCNVADFLDPPDWQARPSQPTVAEAERDLIAAAHALAAATRRAAPSGEGTP